MQAVPGSNVSYRALCYLDSTFHVAPVTMTSHSRGHPTGHRSAPPIPPINSARDRGIGHSYLEMPF